MKPLKLYEENLKMKKFFYLFYTFILFLLFAFVNVSFAANSLNRASRNDANVIDKAQIFKIMKLVADWQLHNPVRFDITFRTEHEKMIEQIGVLWDGTVMSRSASALKNESSFSIEPWFNFAKINSEIISFCELPDAVQSTLNTTLKVKPSQILKIRMENNSSKGWEQGALYTGLYAFSEISEDSIYTKALKIICEANQWKLGPRIYHADDHCVGQLYLDMYKLFKKANMISDVQMRFDWIIKHPAEQSVWIKEGQERWTWCDALFMSPPVWAKLSSITGSMEYLDFMNREWWATADHLYDKKENLFFRDDRYFEGREPNGKKIFWSRGNGWVMAGIARILEEMPQNYLARPRYEKILKEMADKIALLQTDNGLWHPSLLDTEHYPFTETSCSGFFCYAFAWGVNNGLLDRAKFLPVIQKAWDGLIGSIGKDGKLGWVQLPGHSPDEVKSENTASYGVGAFLLAGSEVYKLCSTIEDPEQNKIKK